MQQWRAYATRGRPQGRPDLEDRPRAAGRSGSGASPRPNFRVKVRRLIDPARAEGTVPIFTVLRAQATAAAPGTPAAARPRMRGRARGTTTSPRAIGNDRVVIAFEPDSLGTIDCLAPSRRDDRLRLLRYGVTALSKLPNATIYLEAGASDWEAASRTAKQLRAIGDREGAGLHAQRHPLRLDGRNIQHGLDISRRVGGKHFIINTAENGRGPVHYPSGGRRITCGATPACAGSARRRPPIPPTQGRRLPMDQPARLRAVLPGSADRLVRAAGAQLRALRDHMGEVTARRALRASQAVPGERIRDSRAHALIRVAQPRLCRAFSWRKQRRRHRCGALRVLRDALCRGPPGRGEPPSGRLSAASAHRTR